MGFKPERAGCREWIYSDIPPPRSFITAAMDLTVMPATYRHRKFVTHLATERSRLREPEMVRIRRPAAANQARLFDDVPDMVAVPNTARFGEGKDALIGLWYLGLLT